MTAAPAPGRAAYTPFALFIFAALLVVAGAAGGGLKIAGPAALLIGAVAIVVSRPVVPWRGLLTGLLLIIMFIPIRRYVLPGNLPFQLEPYRLYVILLVGGWLLALLVDPRVRFTRTGFERPLGLLLFAVVASEMTNPARVGSLGSYVLKSMTFFLSFLIVVYVIASVVKTREDVERLVRVLVVGGAVIAVAAIYENRTGYNVFDSLGRFMPFLRSTGATDIVRSGHARAFGPAQHPIALGAALVMLTPLAGYVAISTRQKRWLVAAVCLLLGSFTTLSRTSVVMLMVILVFFVFLRPRRMARLWPALIPLALLTHFVLPGTIGTLKGYFTPSGGLVQQQTVIHFHVDKSNPTWCDAAGRVSRIGPMLHLVGQKPLVGWGYGTRVTGDDPRANTCVLDDQWLGTLVETGLVGIIAWWAVIIGFVTHAARRARRDDSDDAWLMAALGSGVAAFSIGMFLFDAFSFIQVTFFFYVFLGLGAVALRLSPAPARAPKAVPLRLQQPAPQQA